MGSVRFMNDPNAADRGERHHNQSTQRKPIYAGMGAQLDCGKATRRGSRLRATANPPGENAASRGLLRTSEDFRGISLKIIR